MFKNTLQEPQIFLRVFHLLAVEADDGLQGFDRLCVRSAAEIAQRDNVEQAALDARQEPAVVHGFQHIAEQEIDEQIFGLRGEARVLRSGKLLSTYEVRVTDAEGGLVAVATITGYGVGSRLPLGDA